MSHPDEGLLQELLDGELAAADAAAVRTHVASCATCTALLEELQQTGAEASAIVERLDLDPPLSRRHGSRAAPRAWFNPRVMGIAASFLLVAGTAWLLRGRYVTEPQVRGAVTDAIIAQRDTGSSVAESVDTLAPSSEPVKAPAPAPAAIAPAAAPARAGVRSKETSSVNAAVAEAKDDEAAPAMSLSEAKSHFGKPMLTIDGLSPTAVELLEATPDSPAGVRLAYMVSGTRVTLSQWPAARSEDVVTAPAAAPPAANRPRDEVTTKQAMIAATPATRTWEANGLRVTLEGMLPADSLAALARRVH